MKKLLLVAAVVAVVALIVKKRSSDRDDWQDLTADEAREKLADRFPDAGEAGATVDLTDSVATPADDGVTAPT